MWNQSAGPRSYRAGWQRPCAPGLPRQQVKASAPAAGNRGESAGPGEVMWSYWAAGGNVRAEPFHNPLRFHADVHPPRPAGPLSRVGRAEGALGRISA